MERTSGQPSIGALVRRAADPDAMASERSAAFGEIVARFQDMAFGIALSLLGGDSHLAEDAAQEAFLAAWRQLDNLREPEAFPGWFQCVVRTQCNRLTRGKRLAQSPLHLVGEQPADRSTDPTIRAEKAERTRLVQAALSTLPDHERTATVLYYLGDTDQRAIADFLGVPVTTVKKRVFSARKRLRERIAPYMEPNEIVQEALDTGRPSRSSQFSRRVLLWAAVGDGDERETARLLAEDPTLSRTTNADGETPLHLAAWCGYRNVVDALLAGGADPNARSGDGRTPLHALADGSADIEIAGSLLASGADLAILDNGGESPLMIAARQSVPAAEDDADHFGFCEFLLSRGATLDLAAATALDRREDILRLVEKDPGSLSRANADGDLPLHTAARAGFSRVTKALLSAGADPNARNTSGRTPLQVAIQPGRRHRLPFNAPVIALLRQKGAELDIFGTALLGATPRLSELLAAQPELVHARDTDRATPLHHAAWQGNVNAVRLLLERGADATARDDAGRTPLAVRWSAQEIVPEIVDLLIQAGAPMELRTALALSRTDDMEALLNASPSVADEALVRWSVENDIAAPLIERLLAHGGTLTAHDAAALGLTDRLAQMLAADLEMPRRRDSERRTPLHLAAQRGQVNAARYLLERGAAVDAVAGDGSTPLHLACAGRWQAVVSLLLDLGADVHRADHRGDTPLFTTCTAGDTSIAALLLDAGAQIDRPGTGKNTPLHQAAHRGDAPQVELLLARGAAVEARNYYGAAPLHIAVREGHAPLVERLLAAGADRLARDQWHRTPLHTAAWFDQAEIAEILLNAGVAVTELSFGFSTPLHTAAERGSIGVAERLIAHGADVNARTDFLRTPLHDAVHGDNPDLVALLLRHGADPTSPNDRKMTPLHWAAASGRTEIARLLINAGADMTIRSHKEETPADVARRYGHSELAAMLTA